jgi:hypothetical protein
MPYYLRIVVLQSPMSSIIRRQIPHSIEDVSPQMDIYVRHLWVKCCDTLVRLIFILLTFNVPTFIKTERDNLFEIVKHSFHCFCLLNRR